MVCKKKKIEPAETNKLVLNATTLYYDYEYRCAGEHNNRFSKLDDEDDLLEEFITITCQPLANHIIESDIKPKHMGMFKHSFQSRIDDILKGDIEYTPSVLACQSCKYYKQCEARKEKAIIVI